MHQIGGLNQIHFWLFFLGIFEIGQKARNISVEKSNTSLIRGQPKALIPYGVGRVPIFHGIDQEREEREEHQEHEEHGRKSRILTTIQPTLISPFPSPVGATGPIESRRETVR